jgi:hypothetical protein
MFDERQNYQMPPSGRASGVGNGQQAHVELLVDGEELGGVGRSCLAGLGGIFQPFVQGLQFDHFSVGGLAR